MEQLIYKKRWVYKLEFMIYMRTCLYTGCNARNSVEKIENAQLIAAAKIGFSSEMT